MSKLLKNTVTTFVITFAASIVFFLPSLTSADQGTADNFDYELQPVEQRLKPSFSFDRAAHVANGIAMRNRIGGTIHLRGIPRGAKIVQAILYVNILDEKEEGSKGLNVIFNGNLIYTLKVADSVEPCWGKVGSHTYRKTNIKQFMPINRPNQDYQVSIAQGGYNTDGENPWLAGADAKILLEGATLIVIYSTENTAGTVYIYDAFNNSMFSSNGTFYLDHNNEVGSALFTMTGADGQRGSGYNNSLADETSFFNGTQIAGPGADAVGGLCASDWNGMAGWPLNQLWDVQTHIVDNVEGGLSKVEYNAQGDCLVPVAMVIDMQ